MRGRHASCLPELGAGPNAHIPSHGKEAPALLPSLGVPSLDFLGAWTFFFFFFKDVFNCVTLKSEWWT